MLHIGNYVKFTSGVHILTHDYSRSVLCNMPGYENVGEAGFTSIGDNVFIRTGAIILMGAQIGNNSIVGAGSVVSGVFPDSVVIAGNPARIICTIDEFYVKRKEKEINAAKLFVRKWRELYNCDPTIEEMDNSFSWIYLRHDETTFDKNEKLFRSGGINMALIRENYLRSTPSYGSFKEFLDDCND